VNAFFSALQFLTCFPLPRLEERPADEWAGAAVFFPVVGFLFGLILVLINLLLDPFTSSGPLSVLLVTILALLTRGLHLDGLGDTFDGLGAGGDREHVLRIMDDSHVGAFGVIAIISVLLLKIHSIESLENDRWRALLAAPVLGRWSMVLLGFRSTAAKPGLGASLINQLKTRDFVLASIITAVLAAVILRATGVALMASVAVFTIASKSYFHRRLGGVTGDTFGAIGEVAETAVLVLLSLKVR
jgi:adenosylcobinamide-GDP ribazoletransferase